MCLEQKNIWMDTNKFLCKLWLSLVSTNRKRIFSSDVCLPLLEIAAQKTILLIFLKQYGFYVCFCLVCPYLLFLCQGFLVSLKHLVCFDKTYTGADWIHNHILPECTCTGTFQNCTYLLADQVPGLTSIFQPTCHHR